MSLSLLALLLMTAPGEANVATPEHPALLQPVVEAQALCSANPQLTVALTQFTPPAGGGATLVVSLRTAAGGTTELGRVGVFPERPFSAALAGAMRFGFAVPRAALGANPAVVVRITADGGSGAGASAVIGEARIGPAPQERC